jgi:hypothetical protein
MKSVKNQYIALKEGKITEAQFMRNVRMSLPQYISNVTLFKQAEKILINKGIITEADRNIDFIKSDSLESELEANLNKANPRDGFSLGFFEEALNPADEAELEKIVSKHVKDADDISKEMDAYFERGYQGFSDALQAKLSRDDEFKSWVQRTSDEEQLSKEIGESASGTLDFSSGKLPIETPKKGETYLKNLKAGDKFSIKNLDYVVIKSTKDGVEVSYADGTGNMNFRGNIVVKPKIDMPGFEGTLDALDKISIKEIFKIKDSYDGYYNQDGKEQYSYFDELDNMNAQEVMAGYVMEKIDNPNIDINEATKLIIKNLNKDPYYYTNYKLTGVRGEKPVEFTSDKRKPGFDQTEEVSKNGDNLKDTKNAEKVLKEGYKLLSNPSKVKLKELVRKMMKEMFDGRDNVTDVTGENN